MNQQLSEAGETGEHFPSWEPLRPRSHLAAAATQKRVNVKNERSRRSDSSSEG